MSVLCCCVWLNGERLCLGIWESGNSGNLEQSSYSMQTQSSSSSVAAMWSELVSSSASQKLAVACTVWPLVFTPICFALYYAYDSDNYYSVEGIHQIPTISLSGSRLPSAAVLTYGLHMEAAGLLVFFLAIHAEFAQRIADYAVTAIPFEHVDSESSLFGRWVERLTCFGCSSCCGCQRVSERKLSFWNSLALGCGVLTAFCMSMVGSIQVVANEAAHTAFAFLMFVGGVLHLLVFYFGMSKTLASGPQEQFLRQLALFTVLPLNLLVLLVALIVFSACGAYACRAFAVDVLCVLEFTTVAGLLLHMLSFYRELGGTELIVSRKGHRRAADGAGQQGQGRRGPGHGMDSVDIGGSGA